MEKEENYSQDYSGNISIRDLEEKQRNLKDRLILIGQNLIDFKEETEKDLSEIKKAIEILKNTTSKITDFMESLSEETMKFAKKEDLEILTKQAKIFQPQKFVTKEELKLTLEKPKETLKKKENIKYK